MCLLWSTNSVYISQKTTFLIVNALKTSNLTEVAFFPTYQITSQCNNVTSTKPSLTTLVADVSSGSSIGIATCYMLFNWRVAFRVPSGSRYCIPSCRPGRGQSILLSDGELLRSPAGRVAGTWSWLHSFMKRRIQENMDLYIHYTISVPALVLSA
jgi:hypothetical protein